MAYLNAIIPIATAVTSLVIVTTFLLTGWPTFLRLKKHPATAWGFAFWSLSWISVAITYLILNSKHQELWLPTLFIGNVGDLCMLGFVIAYCSGNQEFRLRRLVPLPVGLGAFAIFYALHSMIPFAHTQTPLSRIILIAPSVVLSNVAVFLAGWAFLVRWGRTAFLFFIVSVVYSVAQGPAYLYAFVLDGSLIPPVKDLSALDLTLHNLCMMFQGLQDLRYVFYGLAIGKLLLTFLPAAYFLSTSDNNPEMASAKYWPMWGYSAQLHPNVRRGVTWLLTATVPLLVGALLGKYLR